MEINKIKRSLLVLFFSFLAIGVQAQLEQAVKKIFAGDTIAGRHVPLKRDSDSIYLVNMRKSLEEARLNEANMRMEMEQMKLQMATADSVKYAQQRQRIDSLRQFTKGMPVVADGDTLFYLFTKRGGYTPQQRAQMTGAAEIIELFFSPVEQDGQCTHKYQEEERGGEQRPDQALCAVLLGHHDDLLVGDGVGQRGVLDQGDDLVAHGRQDALDHL